MKLYVGITDEKWLNYHREHKSKEVNFWNIYKNHGNINWYSVFTNSKEPIYFIFKTKTQDRISKKLDIKGQSLYGVGKVKYIDEPSREQRQPYTCQTLWNTYGTKNGFGSMAEMSKGLMKMDINYLSNIIIEDVQYFDTPIDFSSIWLGKYKHFQKGVFFEVFANKPAPSVVDKNSTDEEIGLWIYDKIKGYI